MKIRTAQIVTTLIVLACAFMTVSAANPSRSFMANTPTPKVASIKRASSKPAPKVVFSSVYTNLKTQCRAVGGGNGQDPVFYCKGYGGYEIVIDFSATTSQIRVQPRGKTEQAAFLAMQALNYDETHKVEWRLANGKPFAVILRIDEPKEGLDATEMWKPENIAGQKLIVRGVAKASPINFDVDAKDPQANAKARAQADGAYSAGN